MNQPDYESDEHDGALFRFWCRMASYPDGSPTMLARALSHCVTPADYRKALMELASQERVNLP